MAITVSSGNALSIVAGAKSADVIVGRNQYVGKGRLQVCARGSASAATGIRMTVNVGGVALCDDAMVSFTGTTGAISVRDHMMIDQVVAGGRVETTFRNDSAGTLTVDYLVLFTPM